MTLGRRRWKPVAAALRSLADAVEALDEDKRTKRSASPNAKPSRKAVRAPYVPKREFSEIEIARARERAKKLGIPI